MFDNPRFLLCGSESVCQTTLAGVLGKIGSVACLTPNNFDLTNPGACAAYVSLFKPDCLINIELNSRTVPNQKVADALLHAMIGTDALFVQLSDINVFSGNKRTPYKETDLPDAATTAALREIDLERSLHQEFLGTLIIRLGTLHSPNSPNFITNFLHGCVGKRHVTIDRGNTISLISDRLACKLTASLIKKAFADKSVCSTYHLACIGSPTESQVLSFALDSAKRIRPDLKWPALSIRNQSPAEKNFSYDCYKFQDKNLTILPDWQDGVTETVTGYLLNLAE